MRRGYQARVADIGGWRELPPQSPIVFRHVEGRVPSHPPSDADKEELRRLRAELEEAERRWRAGEEIGGGGGGEDPA
jgi:hypothetical protein